MLFCPSVPVDQKINPAILPLKVEQLSCKKKWFSSVDLRVWEKWKTMSLLPFVAKREFFDGFSYWATFSRPINLFITFHVLSVLGFCNDCPDRNKKYVTHKTQFGENSNFAKFWKIIYCAIRASKLLLKFLNKMPNMEKNPVKLIKVPKLSRI